MKYTFISSIIAAALAGNAAAISVSGAAEGFAAGVTGGGNAPPVYPDNIDELVSYLGDDQERVIVLDKTCVLRFCILQSDSTNCSCLTPTRFDFTGSEGTVTGKGCAPWGTAPGCQLAIDSNNWCDGYQSKAPQVSVT